MIETSEKKEQIIQHVFEVFYQQGFHAAGLERLLEGSGISKRTLYKHFGSKEALIIACIDYYGELFRQALQTQLKSRPHSPLEQILAVFEVQQALFERRDYPGCFALKALLEYDNHEPLVRQSAQAVFEALGDYFLKACRALKIPTPTKRAKQILMLYRGAVVSSQGSKSPEPFQLAREAVTKLCSLD